MTTTEIAAQAGDEPRCPFCDGEPRHLRKLEGIYVEALICDACNFGLAPEKWRQRAAQVSPSATADVERDELMMQCLFSIASGHTYMDNQESLHCSTCNADLDDGEEHSATCLTVRAGEYIATTKPGA